MNNYSSTLSYDQRIAISEPIATPISWKISKVENMNPKGINTLTFTQDRWNEHTDVFEYEDGTYDSKFYPDKTVVGMWDDYNLTEIQPEVILPTDVVDKKIYSVITFSGISASIKSGGSYKKFTVIFYDGDVESKFRIGHWSFAIKGKPEIDANELITILTHEDSTDVEENQIKVKFKKDDTYISEILVVTYTSDDGIESSIEVEILGL